MTKVNSLNAPGLVHAGRRSRPAKMLAALLAAGMCFAAPTLALADDEAPSTVTVATEPAANGDPAVTAPVADTADAAPPATAAPAAATTPPMVPAPTARRVTRRPPLDHSGNRCVGIASFYARHFAGRRMANGAPMRPESDNAASRTLPFGTKAQVTNLHNGRIALVTITDRGPYIRGRIIDLSPRTARQLGITGLARVQVAPLAVPQPDGSIKSDFLLSEAGRNSEQRSKSPL